MIPMMDRAVRGGLHLSPGNSGLIWGENRRHLQQAAWQCVHQGPAQLLCALPALLLPLSTQKGHLSGMGDVMATALWQNEGLCPSLPEALSLRSFQPRPSPPCRRPSLQHPQPAAGPPAPACLASAALAGHQALAGLPPPWCRPIQPLPQLQHGMGRAGGAVGQWWGQQEHPPPTSPRQQYSTTTHRVFCSCVWIMSAVAPGGCQ